MHFGVPTFMATPAPSRELQAWVESLSTTRDLEPESLAVASADAGFRRYYRVADRKGGSYVVMDASEDKQHAFDQFVKIDAIMRNEAGLHAPEILECDAASRYMLLEDLGRETFLDVLDEKNAAALMDKATDALVKWQAVSRPDVLPEYDEATLRRELELFPTWYVERHRKVEWTAQQQRWWRMSVDAILENVLAQERVFVHRDFMPRNLMVSDPMPGVLDFQDALYGPVSYDIASLLKDAFISWGEPFVIDITVRYWEKARKAGIPVPQDFGVFYRDIDFMGVQRHLKVLGIFARLNYRDDKPRYLEDTPRFVEYVKKTASRYRPLSPLARLMNELDGTTVKVGYTF